MDIECAFDYVLYIRPTTLSNNTRRTNRKPVNNRIVKNSEICADRCLRRYD